MKNGGGILLLSDITAASSINFNITNKQTNLRSNEGTYTIKKANTLKDGLIYITNQNAVTAENVTFDGANIESTNSLIEISGATLNLNKGTTVKNNIHIGRYYDEFNNFESCGGGIFAVHQSRLNIDGATISNNSAKNESYGGGIALYDEATCTIKNATISNNISKDYGGGLYIASSTATIENSIITYNQSTTYGGAMVIDSSALYLNSGTISNNTSGYGGGLCTISNAKTNTVYMTGGTINYNTATTAGGGVAVGKTNYDSIFHFKGGIIENNTAPSDKDAFVMDGAQVYT